MSEHTPTPWVPMLNFQIAAQTREIACFASHHLFAPESKANRDFALRACNSHDDLLAALKGLLRVRGLDLYGLNDNVFAKAEAAIAKAEEEQG